MATRIVTRKVRVPVKTRVEGWDTRFGASPRVVTRTTDGKFVTNVSLSK